MIPLVFQKNPEFPIVRDQKIDELASIGKQFIVTFELLLTNVETAGWTSVIHFTTGGDGGAYGERAPALYIYNGEELHVVSAINGNSNYHTNIDALTLRTKHWYNFELSQLFIDNEVLKLICYIMAQIISVWF